jgi:hypothetical protein
LRVARMIAMCSHRSCARTIRRRDRGHALPLCGLPPRHTVLSLAPGWPVDSIAAKSVPSAYLSADEPRPCDCEAGTVRTSMVGSGCERCHDEWGAVHEAIQEEVYATADRIRPGVRALIVERNEQWWEGFACGLREAGRTDLIATFPPAEQASILLQAKMLVERDTPPLNNEE